MVLFQSLTFREQHAWRPSMLYLSPLPARRWVQQDSLIFLTVHPILGVAPGSWLHSGPLAQLSRLCHSRNIAFCFLWYLNHPGQKETGGTGEGMNQLPWGTRAFPPHAGVLENQASPWGNSLRPGLSRQHPPGSGSVISSASLKTCFNVVKILERTLPTNSY